MPKTECASISFPSITLLLSFAYVPVTQVCNRRGNITLEIQMRINQLEENMKNYNFNQFLLTSVWTICGRWLRILETNSKTSTFCSACIMSIMASITINVPVRPTPALKKERKKDKKKKIELQSLQELLWQGQRWNLCCFYWTEILNVQHVFTFDSSRDSNTKGSKFLT